jgi:hypothetical protein
MKHFSVGIYSITLFFMNWLLICIFGYIMFKVKRLSVHKKAPLREQQLHRFDAITDTESEMRRRSDETVTARRSSFNVLTSNRGDVERISGSCYDRIDNENEMTDSAQGYLPPRVAKSFGSSINLLQPEPKGMLHTPRNSTGEMNISPRISPRVSPRVSPREGL